MTNSILVHAFCDLKKSRSIGAALIKQHKNVFGKRRSFGYAVSPFCRSFSMAAGSILPPFRRKLFFRFGFLLYSHSLSKLFLIVGYTGNHKPQMCKHTLFQNYCVTFQKLHL